MVDTMGNHLQLRSFLPLAVILASFACIQTFLSWLRYSDFYTETWDLGINMQMLWSTTHGMLLYEAADYSATGGTVVSFLQIHSTYIALPIALVYSLFPFALTLFAIQAVAVSLSGIPLFLIVKERSRNPIFIYGSIIVFFTNFALISGLFYDYHWEAFLPVEFFTIFLFFSKRKYKLALIPFIAGCLTLEVFPFLMMGIILYFAMEDYGIGLFYVPNHFREKKWLLYLALFLLAILSYVVIRVAEYDILPLLVGAKSNAGSYLTSSVFFLFSPSVDLNSLRFSFTYWALVYLSLGLVPLLFPRHLFLALPWIYETFFLQPQFATYFGNQYGIVTLMSLFLGFVFGLASLVNKEPSAVSYNFKTIAVVTGLILTILILVIGGSIRFILGQPLSLFGAVVDLFVIAGVFIIMVVPLLRTTHPAFLKHFRKRHFLIVFEPLLRYSLFAIVCGCVFIGIILSPLYPDNAFSTDMPGYWFTYSQNSAFNYMDQVVQVIPQSASVVAVTTLFPYVANHLNAYSFLWYSPQPKSFYLPFNSSHLPDFVLVDESQMGTVTPFLQNILLNKQYYGIRSFVYHVGYPGSIYLFQRSFNGSANVYYASQFETTQVYYGAKLSVGASGKIVKDPASSFGEVIDSSPINNSTGNNACIWYGPYITLIPGYYSVNISLMGNSSANNAHKNVPLVYLDSNAMNSPLLYSSTIYSRTLSNATWTYFTFKFHLTNPLPLVEFRGYLLYADGRANGYVQLNFITLRMVAD